MSQTSDSRGRAGSVTVVDNREFNKEAQAWVEGIRRKSSTTLVDSRDGSTDDEKSRKPSPRGAQAV